MNEVDAALVVFEDGTMGKGQKVSCDPTYSNFMTAFGINTEVGALVYSECYVGA